MPKPEHFAKARDLFLRQAYPAKYEKMLRAGTLTSHLEQTGQEAEEMWEQVRLQMEQNLPEDYASRVKELERISEVTRELVNHDLIHVPPPA
jgi:adenylylsulfate kinase-like enzyme